MLTGNIPWTNLGNNFEDAFKKIRNSTVPPLPSQLSKECEDFLKCCLSVAPNKRWKARDLLAHPFINKNTDKSDMYFQISNDHITLRPENDKSNRVASHSSIKQKKDGILKTPGKSQKRYGNENSYQDRKFGSKSSRTVKDEQYLST